MVFASAKSVFEAGGLGLWTPFYLENVLATCESFPKDLQLSLKLLKVASGSRLLSPDRRGMRFPLTDQLVSVLCSLQ